MVHTWSDPTAWQLGGAVSLHSISRQQFRLAAPRTASLSAALPRVLLHTAVLAEYGVTGIPSTFLIGPDGRVLARGLPGSAVADEIARLLPKNSAPAK